MRGKDQYFQRPGGPGADKSAATTNPKMYKAKRNSPIPRRPHEKTFTRTPTTLRVHPRNPGLMRRLSGTGLAVVATGWKNC